VFYVIVICKIYDFTYEIDESDSDASRMGITAIPHDDSFLKVLGAYMSRPVLSRTRSFWRV